MHSDSSTREPGHGNSKRGPLSVLAGGLVLTVFGALSYFLFFYRFPVLRDFPWVNLPLVIAGAVLTFLGWRGVQRRDGGRPRRVLASFGLAASLSLALLFCSYIFFLSYALPAADGAPRPGTLAADFSLPDQTGQVVQLADYHGDKLLLVFYRGSW